MSIWFIESLYEEKWYIESSYDFDFFKTREEAQRFMERYPDSLSSDSEHRVAEYRRVEV
jgi:hypothetical protein